MTRKGHVRFGGRERGVLTEARPSRPNAEMTAAMVCGAVGIAPVKVEAIAPEGDEELLESSAAYIRHWMDVLQADSRAVVIAAARAQKAADYILGHQHREEALPASEAA